MRPVRFLAGTLMGWLALGAGACGSSPPGPIPAMPTYSADVKPIVLQHCVRCHGAGGTLNVDPRSSLQFPPPNGYLDHYEDQGDCTPDDAGAPPAGCKLGARSLAQTMKAYVASDAYQMPPLPDPPLAARDQQIIARWADETTPLP